jgi:hypothetical protein
MPATMFPKIQSNAFELMVLRIHLKIKILVTIRKVKTSIYASKIMIRKYKASPSKSKSEENEKASKALLINILLC